MTKMSVYAALTDGRAMARQVLDPREEVDSGIEAAELLAECFQVIDRAHAWGGDPAADVLLKAISQARDEGEDVPDWLDGAEDEAHVIVDELAAPKSMTDYARAAVRHLKIARDMLQKAQAPRSVERVSLALSSAKGAVRAAGYREARIRELETAKTEGHA
jgi:hypothetical protein